MGNLCSSGLKQKDESSSEQSNESSNIGLTKEHISNANIRSEAFFEGYLHSTNELNGGKKELKSETDAHIIKTTASNGLPMTSPQTNPQRSNPCDSKILPTFENVFNMKEGEQRSKKIVLYILSTNCCENDYYKNIIYNLSDKLSTKCRNEDFEFIISDINGWESNDFGSIYKTIDNSKGHQNIFGAINYAEPTDFLSKIGRYVSTAYVVPVIILGSSLGMPRVPLCIERQDFENLFGKASMDEIALFKKWFQIDNSCEPSCYTLKPECIETKSKENESEMHNLASALMKLFSNDLHDSYTATELEEEIYRTILRNEELTKRCIWIQIEKLHSTISDNKSFEEIGDDRIHALLSQLKNHLSEKNFIKTTKSYNINDEEFSLTFCNYLEKSIEDVFKDHYHASHISNNTNGIPVQLLEEVRLVNNYTMILAEKRCSEDNINEIKRYIERESEFPLIVIGLSEIGKTVLLSNIAENIWKSNKNIHIVMRYANLSEASSDLTSLLGSIASQLSFMINGLQCEVDHVLSDYSKQIKFYLEATELSIILIIDSLDKFENFYDFIPIKLSPTVKLILTVKDTYNDISSIRNKFLEKGIPHGNILKFTNKLNGQICSDIENIIAPHRFQCHNMQISNILDKAGMIHAKKLCSLAWLGCCSEEYTNVLELFDIIFISLEKIFVPDHIAFILLMISLTNWGMRENDCIEIFRKYSQVDMSKSCNIWAKVCWIMGPMLLNVRSVRIAINCFRDAIIKRYTLKKQFVHHIIKEYFEIQPNAFMLYNGTSTTLNLQKLIKLPFHYLLSLDEASCEQKKEELNKSIYFTDLNWINNKIIASGSLPLLSDIAVAKQVFENCGVSLLHIDLLEKFIKQYFNELNYDGHQFMTLLQYFIRHKINNGLEHKLNKVIMKWCTFMDQNNSTYLEIVSDQYRISKSFSGYDMLVYLPNKDYNVATLSTEREEICIWDIKTCARIREFTGIPQPTAMYPVSKFEAAVLCKREIKVINLIDGNFKVTLKGVMNQKMPYFGQHDDKHLVCLSRNRMYVNLMNLESGDCVTTFKAGEDRFLNSLLVSGDGRILVCGDETQKPFPLLVWHLSQRKLLYDLRIPHHEFITSLAAITFEGAYVCVVAKEINEPTPNFIVVYDLQSGTMFKKWKPGCNTVSLAISQTNASVISGLENANILIWDLVTGNCRSKLIGHNAPVSFLKLDPFGNVLLSRNKENRDVSIRLWEIATGKHLAVFTPPSQITNCEILPNGVYVVLTLQDFANIFTLTLKNYSNVYSENTLSNEISE